MFNLNQEPFAHRNGDDVVEVKDAPDDQPPIIGLITITSHETPTIITAVVVNM